MLSDRWSANDLRNLLVPRERRPQFPVAADRKAWENLIRHPLRRRQADRVIALAEAERSQPWPAYLATDCLRYRRDGSRTAMETAYFARRSRLARMAIAEACEGQGRFLDELIDGLWLICDEASWLVSAHYHCELGREGDDPLPDPSRPAVDLFQAETAHTVAEALHLHEAALTSVSRTLVRRVRAELHRRVVAPVRDHDGWFWWKGMNNWSPWVASSVLHTAAVVSDDDELAVVGHRLMGVCDRFIATYHADGGCDEGPMYWGVAGGALLMFLERMRDLTAGAVDIYQEPLIKAMGAYVHRAHLGGRTFMTFADARPGGGIRRNVVWRYGERTGDEELKNLALLDHRGYRSDGPITTLLPNAGNAGLLPSLLRELWWMDPNAEARAPSPEQDVWLDGLQVWVGRSDGLTIAAKAGHNAENHNHNDVGQAILVVDDEPVIIDVGCGAYTAKTFSARRYEHWFLSAVGHNVPQIDGNLQQNGKDYAARDVTFTTQAKGAVASLSMDLAACYASTVGIQHLKRSFTLDRRSNTLVWQDSVQAPGRSELSLRLLCAAPVDQGPGWIDITCARSRLRITYDPKLVSFSRDDQVVDEETLAKHWGAVITGLRFTARIDAEGHAHVALRCERMAR